MSTIEAVAKSSEPVLERKTIPTNAWVVKIDGLPHVTRSAPHEALEYPFDAAVGGRSYIVVAVRGLGGRADTLCLDVEALSTTWNPTPEGLWNDRVRVYGWKKAHIVSAPPSDWTTAHAYLHRFISSPWANKPVFLENIERWIESFPVPSLSVPGLVAYFQDANKRARDIQTPIKPGKYLKKFFGDILSEAEIHEMAMEWSNEYAARELFVTQDADEIERVYRGKYNGSCMHFGSGCYAGDEHPARVYAGPDLGIAYIGDTDSVDGRCLIWPSKKLYFPKFYGDSHRMEAALVAKGWKAGDEGDFEGARLQRLPYGDGFILPYLDTAEAVRDNGQWLIIDDGGNIGARNTNGLSDGIEICDDCEEQCDDRTYIGSVDRCVCEYCRDSNYFYCDEMDDYYPDDQRVEVEGYSYDYLSQSGVERAVSRGVLFFCDLSETYYSSNNYEQVELTDGSTAEASRAERDGYFCEYSEQWSVDEDTKQELSDGTFIDSGMISGSYLDAWLEERGVTLAGAIPSEDQIEMDLAA